MAKQPKIFNVILFFLFLPSICFGADVVINEISWMGNENSGYDEWIELKNNTSNNILLDSWVLTINSSQINLSGYIPAQGFYLLERSDDDSVPNQKADLIYKGGLNNSGAILILYNKDIIVDYIDCSKGWFNGNNDTKQTMERINPQGEDSQKINWQTSADIQGTPKKENSIIETKENSPIKYSSVVLEENTPKNNVKYWSFIYAIILSSVVLRVKKLIN